MAKLAARERPEPGRRCLVVERHEWETGGGEQQLQFPLELARDFFGPGTAARAVTVRVFLDPESATPTFAKEISISREYGNGTRRTNGFPELGGLPSLFVFFEETTTPNTYDVWYQVDKAIVVGHYRNAAWAQARNTQHGRGRLAVIVDAPAPRVIDRIDE